MSAIDTFLKSPTFGDLIKMKKEPYFRGRVKIGVGCKKVHAKDTVDESSCRRYGR